MVGIFDSGIGGLTVVKEIKRNNPSLSFVYLGDTARVPYGTRSPEIIKKFAVEDTKFLLSKHVESIVVACNTVSALALDEVKKIAGVPVYGVIEPAIAKALKISKSGKIGLVGTRATVNSNAYKDIYLKREASMLVPLIEEGFISGAEIELFIQKYFSEFVGKVDTLILGCTHYPIIKKAIQNYLGEKIILVDPAVELSNIVSLGIKKDQTPNQRYFLTDVNTRFLETSKIFLGEDIANKIEKVTI